MKRLKEKEKKIEGNVNFNTHLDGLDSLDGKKESGQKVSLITADSS